MNEEKLLKEYFALVPNLKKVYVVPLSNPENKNTDYLYQFYKEIIEGNAGKLRIEFLSVYLHFKIFVKKLYHENNLLHYHWFEVTDLKSLSGSFWKIFWVSFYKIIGGKIVWTIHNKFPHSNKYKFLNNVFLRYLAKISNRLHVHCESAVKIMSPILKVPESKFFIVKHPDFKVEIFDRQKSEKLMQQKFPQVKIDYNKKIFLAFGAIAEYKGLLEIINLLNEISNSILIIAGSVKKGSEAYFKKMEAASKNKDNIIIISKFISEEEINLLFGITDFVIFNFDDILTSGSVILALNYNKKVIAPAMGCIKDIRNDNLILFEKLSADSNLEKVLNNLVK